MSEVKAKLLNSILKEKNKVTILTGEWGSGKTFIWEDLKKNSDDALIQESLYLSFFGESDLDSIKMKLMGEQLKINCDDYQPYSLLIFIKKFIVNVFYYIFNFIFYFFPVDEIFFIKIFGFFNKKFFLRNAFSVLLKKAGDFNSIFNGLPENFCFVFAPLILKDKVIVLDDIERKNKAINVDVLLGFINEFSSLYGCRFLLILNENKLGETDSDTWKIHLEKISDVKINLNTSEYDAMRIALSIIGSKYGPNLLLNCRFAKSSNIRVVCKSIKFFNELLDGFSVVSDDMLHFLTPCVFNIFIPYYQDGAIKDFDLDDSYDIRIYSQISKMLMSGEILKKNIRSIESLIIYKAQIYRDSNQNLLGLIDDIKDDPKFSDVHIKKEVLNVLPISSKVPVPILNRLFEVLEDEGLRELAESVLDSWILDYENTRPDISIKNGLAFNDFHPKLKKLIENEKSKFSILDLCAMHLDPETCEGDLIIPDMFSSKVELFLANANKNQISSFTLHVSQLYCLKNKSPSVKNFTDDLILASNRIINDKNSGRLGRILKRQFLEYKVYPFSN